MRKLPKPHVISAISSEVSLALLEVVRSDSDEEDDILSFAQVLKVCSEFREL